MGGLENLARHCIDYIKLDCRMSVSKATVFLCLLLSFSSVSFSQYTWQFSVKWGLCVFVSFSNGWLSVKWKTCLTKAVIAQEGRHENVEMTSLCVVRKNTDSQKSTERERKRGREEEERMFNCVPIFGMYFSVWGCVCRHVCIFHCYLTLYTGPSLSC